MWPPSPCLCGCGAPAPENKRFVWGHNGRMRPKRPLQERFWEKVDILEPDECWLWTGTVSCHGYGYFDNKKASRVAWTLTNGRIPQGDGFHGTCVLHRCDVRRCVNPAHLFLGTNADNMRDMVAKGRQSKGESAPKARLTSTDILAIRASTAGSVALAAQYAVKPCTISNIRAGRIWKHLITVAV